MSISTPPPPVQQKKSGFGCLGCGCAILIVIALLFLGLVGGIGYVVYKALDQATSATATELPAYSGTSDFVRITQQKMGDFSHDVRNRQAATIRLSADEINALIANNPDFQKKGIHIFATMTGSKGRLQGSIPTSAIPQLGGLLAGRFVNFDTSFQVSFDPALKSIIFIFDTIRIGPDTLLGESAGGDEANDFSKSMPKGFAQSFGPAFNQEFNEGIRSGPEGAALLDQMKSISIENGQLIMQTQ